MTHNQGFVRLGLLNALLSASLNAATPAQRLSLNFQNMDVRAALHALAEYAEVNMVISDTVKGQISLLVHDVTWDQALEMVLQSKELEQQRSGKIIRITRHEDSLASDKRRFDATQQRLGFQAFKTETFPLCHRQVADIKKLFSESKILSERGHLLADTATNTLFISDLPEHINRIRSILTAADQPTKQVMIEARIVEAHDNFSRDLGVKLNFARFRDMPTMSEQRHLLPSRKTLSTADHDLQGLPAGVNLPIPSPFGSIAALFKASASTLINLELQAMQAENRGQVISSPRLLTADRTEATIEEGSEIPYTHTTSRGATSTLFKKAALRLKVTPQISQDNNIWIEIEINKDSANFSQRVGDAPSVNTKHIHTRVQIENGGTVVLGGIFIDDSSKIDNKVPMLGDLPLVGFLFRSQQIKQLRRELLVFITPSVINNNYPPPPATPP